MPDLVPWPSIADEFTDAILIGNGASRAVSDSVDYTSLRGVATSAAVADPISARDDQAFAIVNETDFERVLGEIHRAFQIARNAGVVDPDPLRAQYDRIRTGLVEAIRVVHPERSAISTPRLNAVRDSLLQFRSVFTTNYDLLLYWAMTSTEGERLVEFADLFVSQDLAFDVLGDNDFTTRTRVMYLHGALHLFDLPAGPTVKARHRTGESLLTQTFSHRDAKFPLIVSEGSARLKLAAISGNDYLTFVRSEWANHEGSLVVFGHSLSRSDAHLVTPLTLRSAMARELDQVAPVAVSLRPEADSDLKRAYYHERLRRDDVIFFDATTHPLGSPLTR